MKIIRATTVPQSLVSFCTGLLKELSSKYEVIALSSPGKDLDLIAQSDNIRTIAVNMERRINVIKDVISLFKLIRVFWLEKPIMVHSMTPKAGLLCMMAAWIAGVPKRVHTFTGLVFPTSRGIKKRILMVTDKITCKCATHIIPEGEGVKNDLINNKITAKPLNVLGFGNVRGVDMSFYSKRTSVMDIANKLKPYNFFVFVYVGRIVKDKGINELCNAFEKLSNSYTGVKLWLVGPYENNIDPISQESNRIIRENVNIETVGAKSGDELVAYYAAADCFVFPSYREGFPNTVLEAGAMDLPCIVTDINGSREIISNGYNGLIVPPYNSEKLYLAMEYMLTKTTERLKMSLNARIVVQERYTISYVRKCLFDYYEQILG